MVVVAILIPGGSVVSKILTPSRTVTPVFMMLLCQQQTSVNTGVNSDRAAIAMAQDCMASLHINAE